ncbi:type II toxin-antitoxin system RelE/ParE family toxin [Desulfonatronospira sp.]|uniref:type II toxin-antitoxin system RelE/ParE family toxin n=1 Tax=Desulfonatronospira sp. TaxID=1962951 RepID=UPI003445FB37
MILKSPPGNRLHKLADDREGQHLIAINDQWRICFRFEDGDAFDIEVCDYHEQEVKSWLSTILELNAGPPTLVRCYAKISCLIMN